MTKKDIEDIIKIICTDDEDFEKPCISPMYLRKELEALALEQEPCEDCISRQAVLEIIEREQFKGDAISEIEKLSSVIPQHTEAEIQKMQELEQAEIQKAYELGKAEQPKTGHWIGQKKIGFGEWKEFIVPLKDGYVTGNCSCSECGEWLTGSDEYLCSGNYCPNCGSRMLEGSDG